MNVAGRKIVGSTATPRSAGFSLLERRFDVARHLSVLRAELLLDDQQQARAAVDDGVADRRREALRRPSATSPMRSDGAVARRRPTIASRSLRRERRPAAACVIASRWFGVSRNPPACSDDAFAGRRARRRSTRDAVRAQPIGIDEHLQLPIALAPDRHVGHAGNRHQPRPDRPLRQRASAPPAKASPRSCRSSSRG